MMRTTFKILTKKREGQSHRETEVTIDWNGVSLDDLKILAKSAIVRDLQAKIQAGVFDTFPEKVEVVARELIKHDGPAEWEYQQPSKARQYETPSPQVSKAVRQLDELLKTLSQDELRRLAG